MMPSTSQRPLGVTLIAIYSLISGIISVALTGFLTGEMRVSGSFTVILLVLSALYIIFALGAMRLRSWSWPLGLLLQLATIGSGIFFNKQFPTFGVIIAVISLIYLLRPNVQRAFGQ